MAKICDLPTDFKTLYDGIDSLLKNNPKFMNSHVRYDSVKGEQLYFHEGWGNIFNKHNRGYKRKKGFLKVKEIFNSEIQGIGSSLQRESLIKSISKYDSNAAIKGHELLLACKIFDSQKKLLLNNWSSKKYQSNNIIVARDVCGEIYKKIFKRSDVIIISHCNENGWSNGMHFLLEFISYIKNKQKKFQQITVFDEVQAMTDDSLGGIDYTNVIDATVNFRSIVSRWHFYCDMFDKNEIRKAGFFSDKKIKFMYENLSAEKSLPKGQVSFCSNGMTTHEKRMNTNRAISDHIINLCPVVGKYFVLLNRKHFHGCYCKDNLLHFPLGRKLIEKGKRISIIDASKSILGREFRIHDRHSGFYYRLNWPKLNEFDSKLFNSYY
ncbi:MAG: hypothetical protein GY750_01925 [Lentisphaerae bacterium]|nr:hypothetical protein [Lentisphaerota bacterium]MCP4100179.1 hypothetical protein [Lentisphaerota bacterium]